MNEFAVWYELGDIYLKAASFDEAIEAYSKAIDLAPNFGWPYRNLASAYFSKGHFTEAVPLLLKSIDLLRSNAEKAISFNKLGDAYRQLGDYQQALEAYQQADVLSNSTPDSLRPISEAPAGSAEDATPVDPVDRPVADSHPEAIEAPQAEAAAAVMQETELETSTRVAKLVEEIPVEREADESSDPKEEIPSNDTPLENKAPMQAEGASDTTLETETATREVESGSIDEATEQVEASSLPGEPAVVNEISSPDLETDPPVSEASVPPEEDLAPKQVRESLALESPAAEEMEETDDAEPMAPAAEPSEVVQETETDLESEAPAPAEQPSMVASDPDAVEMASEATSEYEEPAPSEEACVSDPEEERGEIAAITDEVEMATTEQQIASVENETDASVEDPALDIAPSVSLHEDSTEAPLSDSEGPADTIEAAENVSAPPTIGLSTYQEIDTDLMAQAAYELKQATLPSNRFSRWVKNFKKMLQKEDLLNEALQEDFLYDIEFANETEPDEQFSAGVTQEAQEPVVEAAADAEVSSTPEDAVSTSVQHTLEDDPVAESVEAEVVVPEENGLQAESPAPSEVAPVSDIPENTVAAEAESDPEAEITPVEPPVSTEGTPATEPQADTIEPQVVSEASDEVEGSQPQAADEAESYEPAGKAATVETVFLDDLPEDTVTAAEEELVSQASSEEVEPQATDPSDEPVSEETETVKEGAQASPEEVAPPDVLVADITEMDTEVPEMEAQEPTNPSGKPPEALPEQQASNPGNGKSNQDKKSAFEWNCLGNVYLKAGSYDEAITAYTRAIEMAPKVGWPYRNLASAYFYKGMTAVAIPLYKRSIDLLNNNTEKAASLNKLGDAYRQMGDYQNAMAAYQKADDLTAGINSLLTRARMLVSNSGQD